MQIKGLQKMTLLDYPGKVACTLFTKGCNFRCPFCHNASLVGSSEESVSAEEVLSFLKKRKGILDGVCITGGEPTLHSDLAEFIAQIKALGYAVKLDTNGTNPALLKKLCADGLIDYVAMDIKNSPEKYYLTAGDYSLDMDKIRESIEFLKSGAVAYEFRTTVADELHEVDDLDAIGQWLTGAEKYFIQGFVDSGDVICDGLHACSEEKTARMLETVKKYIPNAEIRGE